MTAGELGHGAPGPAQDAEARVVAALASGLAELVETAVQEILAEIPAYQAQVDSGFVDNVREHVGLHFQAVLNSFTQEAPVTREDLVFTRRYAARRVERVSVADFIHAFHVCQRVLWQAAVPLAIDDASGQAMIGLVTDIGRYFDVATTHAAEVYLEAEELLATAAERVRRDLLDDLLVGKPPAPGPRLDAARTAGLDPHGGCVVIAAVPTAPPHDLHALRGAVGTLARAVGASVSPLTVVRLDEIVVVAPAPTAGAQLLAEQLATAQRQLMSHGMPLAVGMSTVHHGLEFVGEAYQEALRAREHLLPAPGLIALPAITAFDYLTMYGDSTVRRLVSPAIDQFVTEDLERGGALIATLRTYADANLNVKETAERLHVHVNTAHYRLAKIAERTDTDLRSIGNVIELLIATQLPPPGPPRRPASA